jgi:hypothetical protein
MARFGLAFRLFFKALSDAAFAERAAALVEGRELPGPVVAPMRQQAAQVAAVPRAAVRSEAISLLAVLQQEGRLVDFLKESIGGYSDAQIGAAVRDVHRDCAATIDRLFALKPVRTEAEGASIEVPAGFDANRVRLAGNVGGAGPWRGQLRHGGWEATKVEVPEYTGSEAAARVVAAAQVEVG